MSTPSAPAPAAAGEPKKPRSLWDKILTSTPVILTVIATILAGLSTSEMTQAQYYRATAAQFQSKVSDQWNFFQAKRIRGTTMEMTIGLLHSLTEPGEVKSAVLQASADRLPDDFLRAEQDADRLLAAVNAAQGELGPGGSRLRQAAEELKRTAATAAQKAGEARKQTAEALGDEKVKGSFDYLNTRKLPAGREGQSGDAGEVLGEVFAAINPAIPEGLKEIAGRKTERQMAPTLARITEEQIQEAIDTAEERTAEADRAAEAAGDSHRTIEGLVSRQTSVAREYRRAVRNVNLALAGLPAGDGKGLAEVRQAAAAVARTEEDLKTAADELSNDMKAAQLDYTARRYRREAGYNQAIAGLYELQVRKASLESDRHRERSKHFFYAMLAAQAGVTIATFSLAVRHRSTLWTLATFAGVAALALGAYVYMRM
jgi:hypothetical protein